MRSILLVTLEYPPQVGGVANYYYQLVKHLDADNIHVLDNNKDELLFIRSTIFPKWIKGFSTIYSAIKKYKIQHILVGHILPLGTVVALLSVVMPIQFSVFIHGMDITVPQQHSRKKLLVRWVLKRSRYIITVSRYTAEEIKKLLPQQCHDRIVIISPGPSITSKDLHSESLPDKFIRNIPQKFFLSVGRLVERKGFDETIKAMALLHDEYKEVHYIIAGSGPFKQKLKELIQQYNLNDRVHIMEGLNNAEVAQLYQQCIFFIMPSRIVSNTDFEGFGITVLEANAFAKLAIGGNTGGMTDAILNKKTGLLVDPTNPQAIAEAIENLLSKPDTILRLGLQAQQWVKSEHNWDVKAEKLKHLLG